MTNRQHYDRANILIERHRPKDAEAEVRRHLSWHPDDPWGHSLLGNALAAQKRHKEALASFKQAIALSANESWFHYMLADLYYGMNLNYEARKCIQEALRLKPSTPRYWGLKANIECAEADWHAALAAAEQGLAHDPKYVHCKNLRALALAKLGKKDAASATISESLSHDPENALTFAYQGWTHIHNREYDAALKAFEEALRLNPELEWARDGMLMAIKHRHWLFNVLKHFPYMNLNENTLKFVVAFDPRGRMLLTPNERTQAIFTAFAMPIAAAVGVWLAMIKHHGMPHWIAAVPRDAWVWILLFSLNLLVAGLFILRAVQAEVEEAKREIVVSGICYFMVVIPAMVSLALMGKLSDPWKTAFSSAFVAACIGAYLYRSRLPKTLTLARSLISEMVLRLWP